MRKLNPIFLVLGIVAIVFIIGIYGVNRNGRFTSGNNSGVFSQDTKNIPDAADSQRVLLKNGDTYELTASIVKKKINGSDVKMLAYNGSIPGPMITVPQGAEITLTFTNRTDVDSTVHSHGVRVENAFDGVPDVTQETVKPGKSFTYKIKFPDVGAYWYHPHVREDYAQELGLYGSIIVTPSASDYWAAVDREETLFLDDIAISNGTITPFYRVAVDHTLMGRFGNTMLVNGDDAYQLPVRQGERVRFYVTNAANARVFNFAIPNTRMKRVGSDNGRYEQEEWVDSVTLGPSERSIVEVWFGESGVFPIVHKTPDKSYTMGTVNVQQSPVTTSYLLVPRTNQDFIDSLAPLRPYFSRSADKELVLTLDMLNAEGSGNGMQHMMGDGMMMDHSQMGMGDIQKIEWEDDMGDMNKNSTKDTLKWRMVDQHTQKDNMDINWLFKKGDIVKLEILNDDSSMHPMQHPIHIHGQRFLVLYTNGNLNKNLVWKDTVLIQTGDTVQLLIQMDNPGNWMIHCHIPEHMESGMMMKYTVQ